MKIIRRIGQAFMVCPETAKANRGEIIHYPTPTASYALMPCVAVRMLGVCRAVDADQAHRYVEAATLALHFCNATLRDQLRQAAAPLDAAYTYDRCIVVGGYTPIAAATQFSQAPLSLRVQTIRGIVEQNIPLGILQTPMDTLAESVALVSQHVSLNTGDYLLLPIAPEEIPAPPSVRYTLCIGEWSMLDEYVS